MRQRYIHVQPDPKAMLQLNMHMIGTKVLGNPVDDEYLCACLYKGIQTNKHTYIHTHCLYIYIYMYIHMSPYRSCIFCMWSAAHIYYGCAMLYAYIQMHTVHLPAYLPACVYLPPPYLRLHADMHTHTHVYVRTYDRQTERQTDPVIQTCVHTDICFEFTYMHVRTYVHGMHYTRVIYERIYTSALRASIHTHIHPSIHTYIHP